MPPKLNLTEEEKRLRRNEQSRLAKERKRQQQIASGEVVPKKQGGARRQPSQVSAEEKKASRNKQSLASKKYKAAETRAKISGEDEYFMKVAGLTEETVPKKSAKERRKFFKETGETLTLSKALTMPKEGAKPTKASLLAKQKLLMEKVPSLPKADLKNMTAEEKRIRRNEQSKLSRQRKEVAKLLGDFDLDLDVEEAENVVIKPKATRAKLNLTEEEKRLRRNEQSKKSRSRKKGGASASIGEPASVVAPVAPRVKLANLTEEEKRLRRNEQSRLSRLKKKGVVAVSNEVSSAKVMPLKEVSVEPVMPLKKKQSTRENIQMAIEEAIREFPTPSPSPMSPLLYKTPPPDVGYNTPFFAPPSTPKSSLKTTYIDVPSKQVKKYSKEEFKKIKEKVIPKVVEKTIVVKEKTPRELERQRRELFMRQSKDLFEEDPEQFERYVKPRDSSLEYAIEELPTLKETKQVAKQIKQSILNPPTNEIPSAKVNMEDLYGYTDDFDEVDYVPPLKSNKPLRVNMFGMLETDSEAEDEDVKYPVIKQEWYDTVMDGTPTPEAKQLSWAEAFGDDDEEDDEEPKTLESRIQALPIELRGMIKDYATYNLEQSDINKLKEIWETLEYKTQVMEWIANFILDGDIEVNPKMSKALRKSYNTVLNSLYDEIRKVEDILNTFGIERDNGLDNFDVEGYENLIRQLGFIYEGEEDGYRFRKDWCSETLGELNTELQQIKKDIKKITSKNKPTKINIVGKGMKSGKGLRLLELFKGTGSVGKAAMRLGMDVRSLDFLEKYKPDILADMLTWDYKKWWEENKWTPDLIWASPPCNTFSPLAYPLKERNTKTATPYSARAKQGTQILYRTLEAIKFFKSKNPNLLFIIENPRGMMRNDKKMRELPLDTTTYCAYGDFKRKPTDFWSNLPNGLTLKPVGPCPNPEKVIRVDKLKTIEERYSIPQRLMTKLLTEMIDQYGMKPKTVLGGMMLKASKGGYWDFDESGYSKYDKEDFIKGSSIYGMGPKKARKDGGGGAAPEEEEARTENRTKVWLRSQYAQIKDYLERLVILRRAIVQPLPLLALRSPYNNFEPVSVTAMVDEPNVQQFFENKYQRVQKGVSDAIKFLEDAEDDKPEGEDLRFWDMAIRQRFKKINGLLRDLEISLKTELASNPSARQRLEQMIQERRELGLEDLQHIRWWRNRANEIDWGVEQDYGDGPPENYNEQEFPDAVLEYEDENGNIEGDEDEDEDEDENENQNQNENQNENQNQNEDDDNVEFQDVDLPTMEGKGIKKHLKSICFDEKEVEEIMKTLARWIEEENINPSVAEIKTKSKSLIDAMKREKKGKQAYASKKRKDTLYAEEREAHQEAVKSAYPQGRGIKKGSKAAKDWGAKMKALKDAKKKPQSEKKATCCKVCSGGGCWCCGDEAKEESKTDCKVCGGVGCWCCK